MIGAVKHLVVLAPLDRRDEQNERLFAQLPDLVGHRALLATGHRIAQRNHTRPGHRFSGRLEETAKIQLRPPRDAENEVGRICDGEEVGGEQPDQILGTILRVEHGNQVVAARRDANAPRGTQVGEVAVGGLSPIQTQRQQDIAVLENRARGLGARGQAERQPLTDGAAAVAEAHQQAPASVLQRLRSEVDQRLANRPDRDPAWTRSPAPRRTA